MNDVLVVVESDMSMIHEQSLASSRLLNGRTRTATLTDDIYEPTQSADSSSLAIHTNYNSPTLSLSTSLSQTLAAHTLACLLPINGNVRLHLFRDVTMTSSSTSQGTCLSRSASLFQYLNISSAHPVPPVYV